ncbi:uncharacterized protein FA14DRAFT_191875 [Meira miltonrushii]|uniref:DUF7168 domain-containing protein n=1 Tax=Meira miltonrushii TaxID=1280837 RepID=A0A316VB69_9BASI|nr:uncharacterized protein FA14DRAFT_191875 [Meira miltonrushii]PWN32805.1 hypothetical protein FA14DRAFT_191875 [Meira miltonrushii]
MPPRRGKLKKKESKRGKVKTEAREANIQDTDSTLVLRAKVTRLATDPSDSDDASHNLPQGVDVDLIKRLSKILDIAKQPDTSEDEVKQALQFIGKMLSCAHSRDNEAMSLESAECQLQKAGHSEVAIHYKDSYGGLIDQWVNEMAWANMIAFNVKAYHNKCQKNTEHVFYGLRANAAAAALSFEAIINLALTWATSHTKQNCYLLGLSSSILEMATEGEKLEEAQTLEAEKSLIERTHSKNIKAKKEQNRNLEPGRKHTKSGIITDEEEDDVTFVSIKQISKQSGEHKKVKGEMKTEYADEGFGVIKQEQEDDENSVVSERQIKFQRKLEEEAETSGWQNHAKLMSYRRMAERIAEEYCVKELKITKWTDHSSYRGKVRDFSAYKKGQEDAHKMDLKRRRLGAD